MNPNSVDLTYCGQREVCLWLWWAKGYYRNHSPFSTDCNRWSFSRQVVTCPHMAVLVFSSIVRIILIKRISSLLISSHILVCLIDFKKSCCFILLTASQWYTYTWIYILENAIINTVANYSKSYNIQKMSNHSRCVQHETWNRTLTCDWVSDCLFNWWGSKMVCFGGVLYWSRTRKPSGTISLGSKNLSVASFIFVCPVAILKTI